MVSDRRALAGLVVVIGLLGATPSLAQTQMERDAARAAMDEGFARREAGDTRGSLKAFERADGIMHVPTTGLEVARGQAASGLLLEARETALRVGKIPVRPGESPLFERARRDAEALAMDLVARTPSLTIALAHAPKGDPVELTLDHAVAAPDAPRKVNPGKHIVRARARGVDRSLDVDLGERDARTVTIDMTPPESPHDTAPGRGKAAEGGLGANKVLLYGGGGLAATGVIVGSVTGIMALGAVSDARKSCVGNVCPRDAAEKDVDRARTLGTVSTIGFVAAGVGAAAVLASFLMPRSADGTARAGAAREHDGERGAVTVEPVLGLGVVGARGTF